MGSRALIFLLFLVPVMAACGGPGNAADKPGPLVESAPEFTLTSLAGRQVSMSGLKGSPVYLNFWATWCQPCREEMPSVDKIFRVYGQKGLKVYAVDTQEDRAVVEKFRRDTGMKVPVLLDKTGKVMKRYKVFGHPVSYFIRKDGTVAKTIMGDMTYQAMESQVQAILE